MRWLRRFPGRRNSLSFDYPEWDDPEADAEENRANRPLDGENIETHCIWLVEAFPPSHLDGLFRGLQKLGLDERRQDRGQQSSLDWIQSLRQGHGQSGWLNLGYVIGPHQTDMFHTATRAPDFPANAEYAELGIIQPLPSLTFLTAKFASSNDSMGRIQFELERDHRTETTRRSGRSISYEGPSNIKRRLVGAARNELISSYADWIRRNIPGTFGSRWPLVSFPVLEFISLELGRPFEEPPNHSSSNYLSLIGMASDWQVWESISLPGFRMSTPSGSNARPSHFVLAGKSSEIFGEDDLEMWGGRNHSGFINRLSYEFINMLKVMGYRALIHHLADKSSGLRDRAATVEVLRKKATKVIRGIRAESVRLTLDILPVTSDLLEDCNHRGRFLMDIPVFTEVRKSPKDEGHLFELVRQELTQLSTRLREMELELRQGIDIAASLVVAESQDRLQKMILILSVVAVFVAIVSVLVAILGLDVYDNLLNSIKLIIKSQSQ